MADTSEPAEARTISGKAVVLGMLVFGVLATAGIWTYWKLHLAPFAPLQDALAREYPGSLPRVEGGRHKQSPEILRVILKVPFEPLETDERVQPMLERVNELAGENVDLTKYEVLELYLVRDVPQHGRQQLKIERPLQK